MTGRRGLGWVTALTIACLLLGGGALTAFAEHGDKGGHGGHGNSAAHQVVQQQPQHEVEVQHQQQNEVQQQRGADDDDLIRQPDRVTDEIRPGKGCGDDNHEHERNDDCKPKHDNNDDDDQGNTADDD